MGSVDLKMHRSFIDSIMADPHDAASKLAYADWLRDRGLDDIAYAFEWAARRGRHPHVSPAKRSVRWNFVPWGKTRALHDQGQFLPYILYAALGQNRPLPPELRKLGRFFRAFSHLAEALRVMRDAVSLEGP